MAIIVGLRKSWELCIILMEIAAIVLGIIIIYHLQEREITHVVYQFGYSAMARISTHYSSLTYFNIIWYIFPILIFNNIITNSSEQ
jgi:hypothetical protein